MMKLMIAAMAVSASAYQPAVAGSRVTMSRVAASAQPTFAAVEPAARAVVPTMNADGEHETEYEMFDPGWVAVTVGIYSAVLLKFAGIF